MHRVGRSSRSIVIIDIDHHREMIIGSSLQRFQQLMVSNIHSACCVHMVKRC